MSNIHTSYQELIAAIDRGDFFLYRQQKCLGRNKKSSIASIFCLGRNKTRWLLLYRVEAAWPLLFLNNNDPVFGTLLFATHISDLFFSGSQIDPYFQNKNSIVGTD